MYISFPSTILQDALLIKLAFPISYIILYTVGSIIALVTMLFFGWLHYQAPFRRDQQIAVEANQFTYKIQPGLGQDLQVPTQVLVLKTMRKLADEKDLPYYDYLIRVWEDIGKGKDIREIAR